MIKYCSFSYLWEMCKNYFPFLPKLHSQYRKSSFQTRWLSNSLNQYYGIVVLFDKAWHSNMNRILIIRSIPSHLLCEANKERKQKGIPTNNFESFSQLHMKLETCQCPILNETSRTEFRLQMRSRAYINFVVDHTSKVNDPLTRAKMISYIIMS